MTNPVFRFTLFVLFLFGVGCAYQTEIQYDKKFISLEEFTKEMVVELQAGVDKYTNALYAKKSESAGLSVYRTQLVPRAGTQAIFQSYRNYCEGISGRYKQGYCFKERESNPLFYIVANKIGEYAGYPEIEVLTYESAGNPSAVLQTAQKNGYRTDEQIHNAFVKEKMEKEQRERDALAQQAAIEAKQRQMLEARKELAVKTRERTIQKGTRVCDIFGRSICREYIACHTEDFNPNNNMLKVYINNEVIWAPVKNWYACD